MHSYTYIDMHIIHKSTYHPYTIQTQCCPRHHAQILGTATSIAITVQGIEQLRHQRVATSIRSW